MKYLKLLVLFLLPLTFVACDDDEEVMNSGNATVEFGEATITTRESYKFPLYSQATTMVLFG